MSLLRVAFECEDGLVQFTVLCSGCLSELLTQLTARRHWTADLSSGTCDFCMAELIAMAGG